MSPLDELLSMSVEERSKLRWNDPRLDYAAIALEKKYSLPEGAVRAIKYAENTGMNKSGKISPSENDSTVTSPKGAQGIMQFMPSTRRLKDGMFEHNVVDPVESMDAAARYLVNGLKQYKGDIVAAIADYNGGPKQAKYVQSGMPPAAEETKGYLKKVRHFYENVVAPSQQQPTAAAPPPPPEPFATTEGGAVTGKVVPKTDEAAPVVAQEATEAPAVVAVAPKQERVLKYDAGGKRMPSLAEK